MRLCAYCNGPIPPAMNARTRCCSRECGWRWNNRKRAAAAKAARRANRAPCAACGQAIPEDSRAGTKYCSKRCKNRVASALWRQRAPSYMRQYLYGITAEEFAWRLAAQGGGCAICGTSDWPGKGPHVDHNPAIGPTAVRGILCGACNNGLGNFADDPARLRAAADYLEAALSVSSSSLP